MNNEQFRRLLAQNSSPETPATSSASKRDVSTTANLGSRMRSSIPMTPRNVAGSSSSIDFARQLREANAPIAKKFKSTAAPKGSKLADGYVDRARLRETNDENDVAKRIKSLEEMVKLGQMEQEAFEKVRDEIVGGDIKNVHLVKGLDRRLLERARRGEDVFGTPTKPTEEEQLQEDVNIDDALDELEAREVVPTVRSKKVDDSVSGRKRTRDDILREMKEARQIASQQATPQQALLGSKFRKVTEKLQPGTSRLEIDERGREVLVVMDAQGNIKRKVKRSKLPLEPPSTTASEKNSAKKSMKEPAPLGADVVIPEKPPAQEEPDNEDIFADAGTDYNPLADLEDSLSDVDSEVDERPPQKPVPNNMPPPLRPKEQRNYFNENPSTEKHTTPDPVQDQEFLSALRKAAAVADRISKSHTLDDDHDEETLRRLARRKQMLDAHDRDNDDLDLGFGSSRFDDQEEGEETHFKLSKWKGTGTHEKDDGGQNKRKRGGKKKKGDKNSASDVLAVLERRAKGS